MVFDGIVQFFGINLIIITLQWVIHIGILWLFTWTQSLRNGRIHTLMTIFETDKNVPTSCLGGFAVRRCHSFLIIYVLSHIIWSNTKLEYFRPYLDLWRNHTINQTTHLMWQYVSGKLICWWQSNQVKHRDALFLDAMH